MCTPHNRRRRGDRPPSSGTPQTLRKKVRQMLERKLLERDCERQQRLVPPEKVCGLDGGVEVDDRVLLLSDPPAGVAADDLLQDAVEGAAGLQALTERGGGRRGAMLEGALPARNPRRGG